MSIVALKRKRGSSEADIIEDVNTISIREYDDDDDDDEYPTNHCCFCGEECDYQTQACGPCVRNGPMMTAFFNREENSEELNNNST